MCPVKPLYAVNLAGKASYTLYRQGTHRLTVQEGKTTMDADSSLERAQEVMLLQDLRNLAHDQSFHAVCCLLPEPNRLNHLRLLLPVGTCLGEIHMLFQQYPALGLLDLQPGAGEVSARLVRHVKHQLFSRGAQLTRLQDVVEAGRQASERLERERQALTIPAQPSPPLPQLLGVPLAQALLEPLAQALVPPLTDVLVPLLAQALVPAAAVNPRPHQLQPESLSQALQIHPRSEEALAPPASVVTGAVSSIFLSEPLLITIMRDGRRYSPNEYAFLCSGLLTAEGVALVLTYYKGELEVATPGFCRLTKASIVKMLYEEMPPSHNLVIWGHIHPIEGASSTDVQSFDEVAAWDRQVTSLGVLAVHSLGMLINASSQSVRFYDTHTHHLIAHQVVPTRGRGGNHG